MLRSTSAVALTIGSLVLICHGQTQLTGNTASVTPISSVTPIRGTSASLAPILEVLNEAKALGSLEFTGGGCRFSAIGRFPEFPKPDAPTRRDSPLQMLQSMFSNVPTMAVKRNPEDGTFRIVQRGVAEDILRIRIAYLQFESGLPQWPNRIYNPTGAVGDIFEAPEVKAFMRAKDIEPKQRYGAFSGILPTGGPLPQVQPSGPYFEGPLYNVTLSEALDKIGKAFPGLWVYQNCPRGEGQKRRVNFYFFQLRK